MNRGDFFENVKSEKSKIKNEINSNYDSKMKLKLYEDRLG